MFIRLIKILIALNLVALISALSCGLNLRDPKWVDTWHLLVIKVSNNKYQLLRTDTVAANSDLLMFCNKQPLMITAHCNPNGKFNMQLPPTKKCNQLDSISPVTMWQPKVSYCPYDLYSIGFNIQVDESTHFLQAYQVCFDREHLRPVFVINRVYPNADDRPKSLHFNPDIQFFYQATFNAFNWGATFDRFKKLLGDQQRYMNRSRLDHVIDRGHLAPCGDFVTTNSKHATFNMMNVIPQFRTINGGNWERIEKWIRHPNLAGSSICTGVLDCNLDSSQPHCVLQLKAKDDKMVPMFLTTNRRIPIPLWTYKIVKQLQQVFLTLNNIYHEGDVSKPIEFCNVIPCKVRLRQTVAQGVTFCCSYNEFINKNVPHLRNVC